MGKKRKRLREEAVDDEEPVGERPAPNTNFLGRLVLGVATGNQRQIETTTSNAANLSIGATGAASLRLQLQRAANARTAHYQGMRGVVLSSAAQQRLTLCSALLSEVAQGFGFRLNIRWPNGQEVGARQAINAAADAAPPRRGQTRTAGPPSDEDQGHDDDDDDEEEQDDEEDASGAEPEEHADAPAAADAVTQGGGSDGNESARHAAPDPLDTLQPLDVDLEMDLEANGVLSQVLRQPTQAAAPPLAGSGLPKRPAKAPGGSRQLRPGVVLTGRLTSAAFGSIGLAPKQGAGAQAAQAAQRRSALRAAANSALGQCTDAEAAAAAHHVRQYGATDAAALADDDEDLGEVEEDAEEEAEEDEGDADAAEVAGAPGSEHGAGAARSRHIVWNPARLTPPAGDRAAGSEGAAEPPAKRPCVSAGAAGAEGPSGHAAGPEVLSPDECEGDDIDGHAVGGAAAGEAAPAEEEEMEEDGLGANVKDGAADFDADDDSYDVLLVGTAAESATGGEGAADLVAAGKGGGRQGGAEPGGRQAGGGDRAALVPDVTISEEEPRNTRKAAARRDGAASAARVSPAPAPAGRLLGAALAGSLASAGGSTAGRQRAPIHAVGAGGAMKSGSEPRGASEEPSVSGAAAEGAGAGGLPRQRVTRGEHAAADGPGAPRSKASGVGPLGSPAGKLFGAAVRQLQQRRGQA